MRVNLLQLIPYHYTLLLIMLSLLHLLLISIAGFGTILKFD